MIRTCGYDALAQDAVERSEERFPVFCHLCGQRLPFHFNREQLAEFNAEVKKLTRLCAVVDLCDEIKGSKQ